MLLLLLLLLLPVIYYLLPLTLTLTLTIAITLISLILVHITVTIPPYTYQYLLSTDSAPTATDAGWTSSTTANVEAGDYIVYVMDAYGCIVPKPITVDEDPSPEISIAIVDECVDEGLFEVMITLDNPADAMAPFQISVNGAAFQNFTFDGSNQYLISGLSSGLGQTIEVRDLNGCIDDVTFDIYPPLEFNVIQTVELDCELGANGNAELEIEVISGAGPYNYEIIAPIASFNDSGSLCFRCQ